MSKKGIQFRVGEEFLTRIEEEAQLDGVSRNTWIEKAIEDLLENKKHLHVKTNASQLLHDKKIVLVRLDEDLLEKLNKYCENKDINRTIVMIDACISWLAKN